MDTRRRISFNVNTGGGQPSEPSTGGTYTVVLNSQWQKSTTISNPDSNTYDGVYESYSNKGVNNSAAVMYIDISGLSEFKLYIRSYAESNYDYVMVSQLDITITSGSSYSDTTLVKAHTRGNQQSGTSISSYTLVEFTGIDKGSHRITVLYRKDRSQHSYDDRGYVLIPKKQGDSGSQEPDIEITGTDVIYYTSSDGNVVTPYSTTAFGANIVSNNYINGQGIISFDGPVTSIGYRAFYKCPSLTSVTIPNNVTLIGVAAFGSCENLTSVIIGNSVTEIRIQAFMDCISLINIILPDSITEIEDMTFYECTSLTTIYCKAITPPTLDGSFVFYYNGSGRKIYVPTESVDAYKNANYWSYYADSIEGYDFIVTQVAGDVAYWDGTNIQTISKNSWNSSLGTPIGVVVIPSNFLPDGKARILSLKAVDSSGNATTSHSYMYWEESGNYVDTTLTNYTKVPITNNTGSVSSSSNSYGYLPSDNFTGDTSFVDSSAKYGTTNTNKIPSPYNGSEFNTDYSKNISGYNNALSDFNGLSNTQILVGLGSDYVAANAAWKYNDGVSNTQWYLPSAGELGFMVARFKTINNTISQLGGVAVPSHRFWSSTEYSSDGAYNVLTSSGYVDSNLKDLNNYVRPFALLDNNNGID